MANFARIDTNNKVMEVISVNNRDTYNFIDKCEDEIIGIAFCKNLFGGNWKQTSFNSSFRKNYAVVGGTYDENLDAFIPPKNAPDSWVLNQETFQWESPLGPIPELTQEHIDNGLDWDWDEDLYQLDNTKGWILS